MKELVTLELGEESSDLETVEPHKISRMRGGTAQNGPL